MTSDKEKRPVNVRNYLKTAAVLAVALAFGAGSAHGGVVYGIQAETGNILTIDPGTGAVLNSYATPQAIAADDGFAGLSYAAPLGQLLYFNQNVSTTLFRLNPTTGAIEGSAGGDTFANSGLSYQQIGGTDFLYYAHLNTDVHRQTGFGGGASFFFGPGAPTGGLGGDGYGREFGIFGGLIREYNINTGAFIGAGFATPADGRGLAFDGTNLYVSTTGGSLLTLDANTGSILNSVTVAGGALIEIGASEGTVNNVVPEPGSMALLGFGAASLVGYAWRRRKVAVA